MSLGFFDILAVIVTLTALFGFLNARRMRLPPTIAQMIMALALALVLIALARFTAWGTAIESTVERWIEQVPFSQALLQGMLGFLLFAGGLRINLENLANHRLPVVLLATGGVLASTFLLGGLAWTVLRLLGAGLPFAWCLLLGALLSPTDPIAVLNMFKRMKAPISLEATVAGESLFNDGVAVVVFVVLLRIAAPGSEGPPGAGEVALLFAREAGGGLALGVLLGLGAIQLLKRVDSYDVEIMVTLALVMGGYVLARYLEISGPLAMAAAGLLIGNPGRAVAMSERTEHNLDIFWDVVDELLKAVLFVLIGLESLVLGFDFRRLLLGLSIIPVALLVRLLTAGLPVALLRRQYGLPEGSTAVVVWGGLRGGISVALALALPVGPYRLLIVDITYVVVVFSLGVQGLTVGRLISRLGSPSG